MPASKSSDILMKFVLGSTALAGECSSVLTAPGVALPPLLAGFAPRAMFEIDSFNFGISDAEEAEKHQAELEAKAATAHLPPGRNARAAAPHWKPKHAKTTGKVTVQPVTFSRVMDTASTLLLHHCIQRTNFDTVALVKRKASGGRAAGEAYLRLDFQGVMLTQVSWSNDDPVKENYTMIARSITLRYRPQLPDGKLGAACVGFWSMQPNARELPLS